MDKTALKSSEKDRARASAYYYANKDRIKANAKRWVQANPEKRKAILRRFSEVHREAERLRSSRRNALNPKMALERLKRWQRKARAERPDYVLKVRLRGRLRHAFSKGLGRKIGSTLELVGCSFLDLRSHIEKQFVDGMCWERISEIHIDHKMPCAAFDLSDPDQQRACFHYSNLQPLWAIDNRKKGARH